MKRRDEQELKTVDPVGPGTLLSSIAHSAECTRSALRDSWACVSRRDHPRERAALWHSLRLDIGCKAALRATSVELLLVQSGTKIGERYELHAGMLVVRHLVPFQQDQRDRIAEMLGDYEFQSDALTARVPWLADRWHRWLWAARPSGQATPNPEALVLAEACSRLALGAAAILQWEEPPQERS